MFLSLFQFNCIFLDIFQENKDNFIYFSFFSIIEVLLLIIPLLLSVAFFTLVERKIMASLQKRKGPNVVGFYGLLQPFADALKLIIKETIIPSSSNFVIFIFAPILCLFLSIMGWCVIPLGNSLVFSDINLGLLYLFGISSLSVYSIILSGWSSNSKYAFLGSLRAAAQVIAYEVAIGLTLIYIIIQTGDLNYFEIILSQKFI